MANERGPARGAIVTIEVKRDHDEPSQTFRGFGGMPASQRAFWDAVRSRDRRDHGLRKPTGDEYEQETIKALESSLMEKSKSQYRAMADVRVAILGYGSAKIGVAWFGPDVLDVLMDWVAECLKETFRVEFVGVHIERATVAVAEGQAEPEPEDKNADKDKDAKLSIAAQWLASALASLPKNAVTLLLVCLFVIGAFLIEESEKSVEGLIEKRTALIEKLAANRQDPERAWGAAFAALATPACECDAVPSGPVESPPPSPSRDPGPKTAAKGPSCCQQLASAVSSAMTFLANRGVLDAGSDIGPTTVVGR
jgi:hypothetical protein